ncbi:MAG: hypothetical protein LBG18_05955 [Mediterranea sp.]|jgi:hypothetical protein|nr:hypothetical protein [Mediterranea sp.]
MKKIISVFTMAIAAICFVACGDDAWTTDPALEHLYYVGFYKTGTYSDALNYEVAANGTARWRINTGAWTETGTDGVSSDIPIQFHSERVRSYDVTTYFYVTNNAGSTLVEGTDYVVLNESGTAIGKVDGKYPLTWPQAVKGVQNVKIRRLTSTNGVLKINTLDPANGTPSVKEEDYRESTLNSKTGDYEVRGLTHDFNKVTVTFN